MTCRVCRGGFHDATGEYIGCICVNEFDGEVTRPEAFSYARAVTERMLTLSTPVVPPRYDWPDDPADPGEETKP